MGPLVLPQMLHVFSTFHADAMLSCDIIALIKVLGNVDDTIAFR